MTDIEFLGQVLVKGLMLGGVLTAIYYLYLCVRSIRDFLCRDEE